MCPWCLTSSYPECEMDTWWVILYEHTLKTAFLCWWTEGVNLRKQLLECAALCLVNNFVNCRCLGQRSGEFILPYSWARHCQKKWGILRLLCLPELHASKKTLRRLHLDWAKNFILFEYSTLFESYSIFPPDSMASTIIQPVRLNLRGIPWQFTPSSSELWVFLGISAWAYWLRAWGAPGVSPVATLGGCGHFKADDFTSCILTWWPFQFKRCAKRMWVRYFLYRAITIEL